MRWAPKRPDEWQKIMDAGPIGKNGIWPVWPADKFITRRGIGGSVADRIRRLNPQGVTEGSYPRGWNPKCRFGNPLEFGCMSRGDFIRKYGREHLDKIKWIKPLGAGRRKLATWESIMEIGA